MRGGGSHRHEYAVLDRGSACFQCKKRKKRCDGSKPVCGPCVRFGTGDQCEFPRPPTPKLKPKPSPPRSKSEQMRIQIRELEEQLATLQNAIGASASPSASVVPSSRATRAGGLLLPPIRDDVTMDEDEEDEDDLLEDEQLRYSKQHSQSPKAESHSPHMMPNSIDPSIMTDELMRVFIRNRHRCAFEVHEARFIEAFQQQASLIGRNADEELSKSAAPATTSISMHPALVNAVLLLGTHFAALAGDTRFLPYESYFLHETREHLSKSLTGADRLHDFLRGTTLLVWYYFAKGRIAEAQYHASGVSCFASACRLNVIDTSASNDLNTLIIAPPADDVEAEERVSLFWSIYVLDRYSSLMCGTTSTIRDECVWTPWPREPAEWEYARQQLERNTVLYPGATSTRLPVMDTVAWDIPQSDLSLRAVALALLARSIRLSKAATNVSHLEYELSFLQDSYETTFALAQRTASSLPSASSLIPPIVSAMTSMQAQSPTNIPPHQIFLRTSDTNATTLHHDDAFSLQQQQNTSHTQQHPSSTPFVYHPHSSASSSQSQHALLLPTYPRPSTGGSSSSLSVNVSIPQRTNSFEYEYGTSGAAHGGSATSSPHHYSQQQQQYQRQDGRSSSSSYSSSPVFSQSATIVPRSTAALFFAHSALCASWIHLNSAALVIPPIPSSGSTVPSSFQTATPAPVGDFYRPPPQPLQQRSQSTSKHPQGGRVHQTHSAPAAPARPLSAMAEGAYPSSPVAHAPSRSSPQTPHQFAPAQYATHPHPGQPLPISISVPVSVLSKAAPGTAWRQPQSAPPTWGESEGSIPPWISGYPVQQQQPYNPPHHQQQQFQQHPLQSTIPPASGSTEALTSLGAAMRIAELAGAVLSLPTTFDQLDMMIGLTWTAAFDVLSGEVDRRRALSHESRTHSSSPHSSPHHSSSPHSHHGLPAQPQQQHDQQLQHALSQTYLYGNQSGGVSYSSFAGPADDSAGLFDAAAEAQHRELEALKTQRDIVLTALDRLSGMFQLVGAMRTSSF